MEDDQKQSRLAPGPVPRMKSESQMSVGKGYRLTRARLTFEHGPAMTDDGQEGPDEGGYG